MQLRCDRDSGTFVCQPCWRKVYDFHGFYQSVLVLYQSRNWPEHPQPEPGDTEDFCTEDNKLDVLADVPTTTANNDDDCMDNASDGSDSQRDCNDDTDDDDDDSNYEDDRHQTSKFQIKSETSLSDDDPPSPETPPKRKRGRPPKPKSLEPVAKRKLGRPPQPPRASTVKEPKQCPECDKWLKNADNLHRHIRIMHRSTPATCEECGQAAPNSRALKAHQRSMHGEPTHVCDVCAKLFKSKASYELHYAQEHGTVSLKCQCPVCGKWLKHPSRLGRHMLLHKGRPVTCADCGHRAPNDRALYAHRSKLHHEPRHQCMACGKKFRVMQALREHMAMHAGITDLYTCAYCPKTFRSTANMYKHRRQMHAEQALADKLAVEERNAAEAAEAAAAAAAAETTSAVPSGS